MKKKVCVITNPRTKAATIPMSNLIDILVVLSSYVYLITGNEGGSQLKQKPIDGFSIIYKARRSKISRVIAYAILQTRIILEIIKISRKIDYYLFFMGEGLLFPLLACKMTGKPVVLVLAASAAKIEMGGDRFSGFLVKMENISYGMADRIIVYSPALVKEWNLVRFQSKVRFAHEHIINMDQFKIEKPLAARANLVSYIGRFSEEKGIERFVQAVFYVVKERSDLSFMAGGTGPLKDKIEQYLAENKLTGLVMLPGWISHDNLADYLNDTKLLVLPSYTEGLPNIMLEALACGTPVLATQVGTVPDYIKDSETGFIMENNSPECLARNITRALNHPDLEKIALNGRRMVEREFTFNKTVDRFEKILTELKKDHGLL